MERRQEWASKASARSAAAFEGAPRLADAIPLGQPILVGHHSERRARRDQERIVRGMHRGVEEQRLAQHHASTAAGLADALERSIYSDDSDALEQLRARIAEREAERDRIKAYNATCRAAHKAGQPFGDVSLLSDEQRRDLHTTARVAAYQLRPGGAFPAYVLSNLAGRIKADRDRLAEVETRQQRQADAEASGGVVVARHADANWCVVTFAERPDRSILDALRSAGYHFSRGSWHGYLDRLPAEVTAL